MSLSTEPRVYGRDENREQLVKQLLGSAYMTLPEFCTRGHPTASQGKVLNVASSSSKDTISVFPILGMGGLGKTTLAQLVYHDERVENHFKDRSWVCVSDYFDIKRIMKVIIASISGRECTLEDLELLQLSLQKEVHGKRLLLVLDDVWEESQEEWNKMMKFFEGVAQGSSIIMTTRLSTVASIASALPSHHCLNGLSKSGCWALFKQYAFGPGNEERPALVKIGKEIVKKCGGLPLAVKALGGLLRFKSEENEWLSIKENPIWELPQSSLKGILPVLRLSYCHLSSELKRCFVHCSIFRKDHKIGKEELIQLWIANGLVKSRANIELEDTGNEIFNAMLWRSFFQDTEKDGDGNILRCKMHDLVHDLASCIAGDEYFVEDSGSVKNITKRTRHVSSSIHVSMQISSPRLRSLIRPYNGMKATSEFEFVDFMRLRALNLKDNGIKVVPDCIGEMIYLRCLNLSYNYYLESLPESICLLRNMHTLNLSDCGFLRSLPKNIGNMSNLIHLNLRGCRRLSGMPVGIWRLTRLRTLSYFTVSKGSSSGIGGLQLLNKLGETLTISRLWLVKNEEEAKEANLMSKKDVRSLGLFWTDSSYSSLLEDEFLSPRRQQQQENENVIEGLQPHVNVRELEVRGYQGETLSPSWLTEASLLPNLVQICFSRCKCEHLGSLRKLPRLKVLKLLKMDSLKFIVEEEVMDGADAGGIGFPSLEELSLESMPNLKGWSSSSSLSSSSEASAEEEEEEEGFPSLERLSLEEPMRNLEGSSSSSSQAPAAAEIPCLKSKSAKKLERCPKLLKRGRGGGGLPLSSSSLSQPPITQQVAAVFPGLKSVTLVGCPKLKGEIPLAWSPVQGVHIRSCNGMVLASLRDLPCLPSLLIDRFVKLEYFPPGTLTNLTALHKLRICYCHNLKALPVELYSLATLIELEIRCCSDLVSLAAEEREGGLKNLSSLKTLIIHSCGALKRLPQLDKTSLHTLTIRHCNEMEFSKEDFEHLVVLEDIQLYGLSNLTCFPEGLKHSAATLRHLRFRPRPRHGAPVDLPNWIGTTLTSLEYLEVDAPNNWNVLPQWMQHLTALKVLVIWKCDEELVKRWENRDGQREDDNSFNMIYHVPYVSLS